VPLDDQDITSIEHDVRGRCTIHVYLRGHNVSTENQYLVLFALGGLDFISVQFFVNTDLVRTEELGPVEAQVAILLDCPGDGVTVELYVRLASSGGRARMAFQGMDCYLL